MVLMGAVVADQSRCSALVEGRPAVEVFAATIASRLSTSLSWPDPKQNYVRKVERVTDAWPVSPPTDKDLHRALEGPLPQGHMHMKIDRGHQLTHKLPAINGRCGGRA